MNFKSFLLSEDGAVTIDWVVLTAGLVGLGLATVAVASSGVENLSDDIANALGNVDTDAYDWAASGPFSSSWGDLAIFSPHQTALQAEAYALHIFNQTGQDYQATYDQLYQQVLDMTYAHGESIDDFGAFEAYAAANGVQVNTGTNMTYTEMHAIYEANGSL